MNEENNLKSDDATNDELSKLEDDNQQVNKSENSVDTDEVHYDISEYNTKVGNRLVKAPTSLTPIGYMTDVVAISNDLGYGKPYQYLEMMVKHSSNAITRPGDALILYQKSRELNIGWSVALENIYMIPTKGGTKTAISVHLAKAMLRTRSNVTWEQSKDFGHVYKYVAKIGTEVIILDDLDELSYEYVLYDTVTAFKNHDTSSNKIPVTYVTKNGVRVSYDRVSEYIFKRDRKVGNKVITESVTSFFTLKQAEAADLIKPKGNYEKYPNLMLDHRAFMNGARKIAPDIMLGMYAPAELDGVEGVTVLLDKDGNPIKNI